jgi:importin-5
MSLLPPEVHAALGQLLKGLQAADNVERTQAEEQLNTEWVTNRPEILLMGLSEQIQGQEDPSVRRIVCLMELIRMG